MLATLQSTARRLLSRLRRKFRPAPALAPHPLNLAFSRYRRILGDCRDRAGGEDVDFRRWLAAADRVAVVMEELAAYRPPSVLLHRSRTFTLVTGLGMRQALLRRADLALLEAMRGQSRYSLAGAPSLVELEVTMAAQGAALRLLQMAQGELVASRPLDGALLERLQELREASPCGSVRVVAHSACEEHRALQERLPSLHAGEEGFDVDALAVSAGWINAHLAEHVEPPGG